MLRKIECSGIFQNYLFSPPHAGSVIGWNVSFFQSTLIPACTSIDMLIDWRSSVCNLSQWLFTEGWQDWVWPKQWDLEILHSSLDFASFSPLLSPLVIKDGWCLCFLKIDLRNLESSHLLISVVSINKPFLIPKSDLLNSKYLILRAHRPCDCNGSTGGFLSGIHRENLVDSRK